MVFKDFFHPMRNIYYGHSISFRRCITRNRTFASRSVNASCSSMIRTLALVINAFTISIICCSPIERLLKPACRAPFNTYFSELVGKLSCKFGPVSRFRLRDFFAKTNSARSNFARHLILLTDKVNSICFVCCEFSKGIAYHQ